MLCRCSEGAMAYIMLQYDRPTDVRNWNDYNGRVKGPREAEALLVWWLSALCCAEISMRPACRASAMQSATCCASTRGYAAQPENSPSVEV